jgi:hypothetical protein
MAIRSHSAVKDKARRAKEVHGGGPWWTVVDKKMSAVDDVIDRHTAQPSLS